jgi:Domain of unknown function (DUF4868)
MNFDHNQVKLITLYGYFKSNPPRHVQIPIANPVQTELTSMLRETIRKLGLPESKDQMNAFNPAEKYSPEEKLKASIDTDYLSDLSEVLNLKNLPSEINALNKISELDYYYAIFKDSHNRRLHAFRRASQFKVISKSKLMWITGGSLEIIQSPVFRLDLDFDYIVSDSDIFILRPSGFEFTTNAGKEILKAVNQNAQSIATTINYLDVTAISKYASSHKRSARLLAAIKGRNDLHLIDRALLVKACQSCNVLVLNPSDGKLSPSAGHEYEFLCILERRVYTANLIPEKPEKYEATSRVKK